MWLDTVRLSHFPRFGDNWIEDSAKMAPYFSHDLKVFVKNAKMDEVCLHQHNQSVPH